MIFKKSLLVLVTVVILSASLFVSGCSRGRMQNTTEALDMSLSITTSAPTPAPTTTAKETTPIKTTTKSATTQAPTTQEDTTAAPTTTKPTTAATTAAPTTTKPTTAATTTRPTTAKPTTQEATTAAPTTTQAPTTQATTTAPTTAAPTPEPTTTAEQEILMHLTEQQYKDQVFSEINNLRARNGIPTLAKATGEYAILQQMADIRARELAQMFAHARPDGRDYVTIASDMGYDYFGVGALTNGDIIARLPYYEMQHVINGSPQYTVNILWHESYSHRMIMLQDGTEEYTRPNTHMAVGYYNGRATNTGTRCQYVIVIFGKERLN